MYKQIVTHLKATLYNGVEFTPVATLADESGGVCHIDIDDHCYVLRLLQPDGKCLTATHIFPEAFEVLKNLPSPNKEITEQEQSQ